MDIIVKEESTIQAMEECIAMGNEYYNEVESKSDFIPFNPDMAPLRLLIEHDMFMVITARVAFTGQLIGFCTLVVTNDFMTQEYQAKEVSLYVHPDYRGGRTFFKMMKLIEDKCKERGVKTLIVGFKLGHNDKLPIKLGFEPTETIYQKFL